MREFEIERQFGIKILELKPRRGVFNAITDKGEKCVKKLNYGPQKLMFIHAAKEHLVKNGFPYIDRYDLNIEGEPYALVNDDLYTVSEWISGQECDFHNMEHVTRAAKTLATLHEASKGYDPPENCILKTDIGRWPATMEKRIKSFDKMRDMCRKKNSKSNFDMTYLKNMEYYKEIGAEATNILKTSKYYELSNKADKEKMLCHHDFTYHNIIMGDDGNIHVVDFDYCKREIRTYDIANFMTKVLKRVDWNIDYAVAIINSYNEVSQLSDDEYKVLYSFLMFPQRFWRLANKYYYNKSNLIRSNMDNKLVDLTQEKKMFERFLDDFKKEYNI